jgi:branched-chain amino acid transport system substrate-binding protein
MKSRLLACFAIGSLFALPAHAEEITVAAAAPITGPQAYFGTALHNGMRMYFEEANAAGGINGVTFVFESHDDKADPREGTLVAQRFCDDDDVVIALAHLNSGVTLPTLPIYADCGIGQVVLASNPTITQQGHTHIVRPVANDLAQGKLPAEHARAKLNAQTAAIVHDKQAFGQGVSEIFEKAFKDAGGKVSSISAVNPTDVDFTALITQLKGQSPDVVYLGAVMPQLSLFAKQMKEQGLNAQLIVPDGAHHPDFISQAGADAAEGVLISFQMPPIDANDEMKAFNAAYKERFKEDVGAFSIFGYVAAKIVGEAVKQAKEPTREGLLEAIHNVNFDSPLGKISFTPEGDLVVAPIFLYQVKDGNFVLVGQTSE